MLNTLGTLSSILLKKIPLTSRPNLHILPIHIGLYGNTNRIHVGLVLNNFATREYLADAICGRLVFLIASISVATLKQKHRVSNSKSDARILSHGGRGKASSLPWHVTVSVKTRLVHNNSSNLHTLRWSVGLPLQKLLSLVLNVEVYVLCCLPGVSIGRKWNANRGICKGPLAEWHQKVRALRKLRVTYVDTWSRTVQVRCTYTVRLVIPHPHVRPVPGTVHVQYVPTYTVVYSTVHTLLCSFCISIRNR